MVDVTVGWSGYAVHEILKKEKGIDIGYSTLTRLFRELGLGPHKKQRCMNFPDQPGEEMQNDTSPYLLKIGDKSTRVIGSILYFRYSKIRYLKFYRSFDRFKMKCFFHEALIFFGYTAGSCIIDNTNLARFSVSGEPVNMPLWPLRWSNLPNNMGLNLFAMK